MKKLFFFLIILVVTKNLNCQCLEEPRDFNLLDPAVLYGSSITLNGAYTISQLNNDSVKAVNIGIDWSHAQLPSPIVFSTFKNLKSLRFEITENCQDTSYISAVIDQCNTLQYLTELEIVIKCGDSSENRLPKSIIKLSRLTNLIIKADCISILPYWIGLMQNLELLVLSSPCLSDVSCLINSTQLNYLIIKSDKLSALPDLSANTMLKGVYLSTFSITPVNTELYGSWINAKSLDTVCVSYAARQIHLFSTKNGPSFICIVIPELGNNVTLDFSNTSLPRLNIFYLPNVDMRVDTINFNRANLPSLEVLELGCRDLPSFITIDQDNTNFPIRGLTLYKCNKLSSLGGVGIRSLNYLALHDLSPSNFNKLLDQLANYQKLETLVVSPETLVEIPRKIRKLSNLKELIIRNPYYASENKTYISQNSLRKLKKLLPNCKIKVE